MVTQLRRGQPLAFWREINPWKFRKRCRSSVSWLMVSIRRPAKSFRPTCLYQQPQVVRALHRAAGALEFQDERERAKKFLPANAGKSWSNQEDAQICDEPEYSHAVISSNFN